MILDVWNPPDSLFIDLYSPFMDLNMPGYFKEYEKIMGTFSKMLFHISKDFGFRIFDLFLKRRAPEIAPIHVMKS